jgi:predicted DsbA family dithiol-disulfide isomerase
MENENIKNEQSPQFKISTPVAIIIAGFLIMVGIFLSNNQEEKNVKEKTLSEQVGVSKEKFASCMEGIDKKSLALKMQNSSDLAMKGVPQDQRGTPYGVIIGENEVKAEIRGAYPYEKVQDLINEVISGSVSQKYTGEIVAFEEGDHVYGNPDAPIKIIEYSDFECSYCKVFHQTMKKTVDESDGKISWTYRHWPIQRNSFEKAIASECVAKIKGNDAFFAYSELLFGLLKTSADPVIENL